MDGVVLKQEKYVKFNLGVGAMLQQKVGIVEILAFTTPGVVYKIV